MMNSNYTSSSIASLDYNLPQQMLLFKRTWGYPQALQTTSVVEKGSNLVVTHQVINPLILLLFLNNFGSIQIDTWYIKLVSKKNFNHRVRFGIRK
jgi:UDP-N-acetylenolpyruvoylglucosamine reductase